jgi:hypothetical protein
MVTDKKTSGFAITALVMGILSFFLGWLSLIGGVFSILAIVFGIIGLKKTKDGAQGGQGMAITGLVLGIITILLIPLVFIGSLAYFGVLSPSEFLPERCFSDAGIFCDDFEITSNSVHVVVKNYEGRVILFDESKMALVSIDGGPSIEKPFTTDTQALENNKGALIVISGLNIGKQDTARIGIELPVTGGVKTSIPIQVYGPVN